jgi:hypothetical protein
MTSDLREKGIAVADIATKNEIVSRHLPDEGRSSLRTPAKRFPERLPEPRPLSHKGPKTLQRILCGERQLELKAVQGHCHQASGCALIGNDLRRLPVAAKMALQIAGATGGTPVSPMPPGGASLGMM